MITLTLIALFLYSGLALAQAESAFSQARPVWLEGRETEMNVFAGFRAVFEAEAGASASVRVTASTLYRLYVNGSFVGHGPARGPHGHYRVDVWDIGKLLRAGENVAALEVAGYNANSYYVLDQPSFVQAEVLLDGDVAAATGVGDNRFEGFPIAERLQKVQRYSFQRPFVEVYRLAPGYDAWRADAKAAVESAPLAEVGNKALLARGVPYPRFDVQPIVRVVSGGTFETVEEAKPFRDRSLVNIGPELKGYPMSELELVVSDIVGQLSTREIRSVDAPGSAQTLADLSAGQFQVVDLGANLSGFIRLRVSCSSAARLLLAFDEMESGLDVNWRRLGCVNVLLYDLEPGEYELEAFEPHTLRYLKSMVIKGACGISDLGLRRYEHPGASRAGFQCADENLNRIFEAGRSTFAQNSVDIFMDCPHRERAGWLCDSFFTARTALALCGVVDVERNFLENFLLPERFEHLPEGMLPMCYPADHYDGVFIPNWSLWFLVQLGEYAARVPKDPMTAAFRPRIEALLDYFARFENSDGLLENLESWVFVEWSAANNFTQNVNYPSNMLYAAALETAAALYDHAPWRDKAEAIRETIRTQGRKGLFFIDNALRENGALELTDNMSEVCQYFAFYFNTTTPERDPELWRVLLDEFGPDRVKRGAHAQVHPANAFVGNMLRFELLSRAGRAEQVLRETSDYLMYMVERTGTLWENIQDHASLNHGFASHIVVSLYRDILGVRLMDLESGRLALRLNPMPLEWCSGVLPAGDRQITVQWKQDEQAIRLYCDVPQGCSVEVENLSGKELIRVDLPPVVMETPTS